MYFIPGTWYHILVYIRIIDTHTPWILLHQILSSSCSDYCIPGTLHEAIANSVVRASEGPRLTRSASTKSSISQLLFFYFINAYHQRQAHILYHTHSLISYRYMIPGTYTVHIMHNIRIWYVWYVSRIHVTRSMFVLVGDIFQYDVNVTWYLVSGRFTIFTWCDIDWCGAISRRIVMLSLVIVNLCVVIRWYC